MCVGEGENGVGRFNRLDEMTSRTKVSEEEEDLVVPLRRWVREVRLVVRRSMQRNDFAVAIDGDLGQEDFGHRVGRFYNRFEKVFGCHTAGR